MSAKPTSIDPAVWGRQCWDTLLYCAVAYPLAASPEDKEWATKFYTAAVHMLPCPECREHGSAYVAAKPPAVEGRDALFKWVVDYRNAVNIKVGVPQVALVAAKAKYMKTPLAPPSPLNPPKPPQTPVGAPRAAAPTTFPAATQTPLAVPQARARPRINHDAARRSMGLNNATAPATKVTARGLVTASRGPVVTPRGPVSTPRGPSKPRAPRKKCNCGG